MLIAEYWTDTELLKGALERAPEMTLYDEVSDDTLEHGVTEQQAEALITAYDDGYFEVPRGTSQVCLAEQLDISSQAISERLRRGTAALIETRLAVQNVLGPR